MKFKQLLPLLSMFTVIAAICAGAIFVHSESNVSGKFGANVVQLSEDDLDESTISSCFSECFYSTKNADMDTVDVYKSQASFNRWKSKYWDIPQTYPEGWGESMSQDRFRDGYIALVVAPSQMQDPNCEALAACKYTDDNGNITVELQQVKRDSHFGYRRDPNSDCHQVYTVIYLKQSDVNAAETITIGIMPDEASEGTDEN